MNNSVLVIGGGIAGIQASIDLANMGFQVHLVEKSPSIGGKMAQLDKTFPTNDCSMCILAPKMIEAGRHPKIQLLTHSQVEQVTGTMGDFKVRINRRARYVDESKCKACGDCVKACPVEIKSEFDQGLSKHKAIYIAFPQAVPNKYLIDKAGGYPPCRVTCPAGVNGQGYIALISQKKFKEAIEVVRRTMPFPGVCGRVCTHPCETECERGTVDQPVAIRALKRFIADYESKAGREKATPTKITREEKIAIVGSGPAGLTCAYDLIRLGYPVTVFEAAPEPGGLLRYGIPEYRLPKAVLDNEISYLQELGIDIKTATPVKDLNDIFKQGYKAIFIGAGAWVSQKMGIPGEDTAGVLHALDFLKAVNSGDRVSLGNRVAVVGGGNAAVDAARIARRLGAGEVTVVYRRSRAEMPAIPGEIEDMEHEGIKLYILAAPVKVLSRDGKLTGVECIRMELGEPDASGRRRPVPVKDSEFTLEVDRLIIATGQSVDKASLSQELAYTNSNTLKIDPVTLATSIKGVFAGGDVVRPADVITAIAAGKEAAISIDRYLRGTDLKEGRPEVRQKVKDIAKKDVLKKARATMPALEPAARVSSFVEVETGFDETAAVAEAARCLNCGICSECLECLKACEAKAVDHQLTDEVIEVNPGAIIVATGFDLYDPTRLPEYGYAKIGNVITAMEFERLTSASGPTAGELKRASDGKIPTTIAFIQCVGSRDFKNKSYCSSVCCMHATKETILANEHHPETKSYIFCMDMRAVGKRFQEYVARAKQEYNVTYIRGRPGKIDVNPQNQNPVVWYEDTITGETKQMEVDLAVLCQALVPAASVKELAVKLGVGVDEHGFARLPDGLARPVDTDKAGIFFCGYAHSPRDIPDSVVQASAAAARAAEVLGGNN